MYSNTEDFKAYDYWEDIMKKLGLLSMALLAALSLAGCGSQSSHHKNSSKAKTTKVVKHHKKHNSKKKKSAKKTSSSSASSANNQQQTQQQQSTQQQQRPKSQSEINRERGYDPNGNPLLPGQDHAAGSNPDGTPDAWVQGQINWAKQNGYLNPDGSETDKGRAADQWVEENAH